MTEKTQNTRSSPVFREVLAEMMRERGIDPDVEERGVAERLPELEGCGFLGGVALALDLSEPEMMELSHAYAFGMRAYDPRLR